MISDQYFTVSVRQQGSLGIYFGFTPVAKLMCTIVFSITKIEQDYIYSIVLYNNLRLTLCQVLTRKPA